MGSFVCIRCNRPVFLRTVEPPPVALQLCYECERAAAVADEATCFAPPDELTTCHDSVAAAAQHLEQLRAARPMPAPNDAKSEDPNGAVGESERWLVENKDALESSNRFVEEHGLPLSPRPRPLA